MLLAGDIGFLVWFIERTWVAYDSKLENVECGNVLLLIIKLCHVPLLLLGQLQNTPL